MNYPTAPTGLLLEQCRSTNDEAKLLAEKGAAHGSWVSARSQESGRGRLGREWQSLTGNLFLSVIVRFEDDRHLTWIPLVTALTIAGVLRERFSTRAHLFPVQVKWPNDLEVDGKKLGGILCEGHFSTTHPTGRYVIVGIGLNLVEHPEVDGRLTTSVWKEYLAKNPHSAGATNIDHPTLVEETRIRLVAELPLVWSLLEREGPYSFLSTYEELAALKSGDSIEFTDGERTERAVVEGLGEKGELLVRPMVGEQVSPSLRHLFAEEVRVHR